MKLGRLLRTLLVDVVLLAAAGALVRSVRRRSARADALDEAVTDASKASFPASDPPSFTPTSGPRL